MYHCIMQKGVVKSWNFTEKISKRLVELNALYRRSISRLANIILSYGVASWSEITPCNKIDRPLVVYRFSGNVLTSITTLRA